MKAILLLLLLSISVTAKANDSIRAHHLRPLEVLGVKQIPDGGTTVEAVTTISGPEARKLGIEAPKGVSIVAPNFFMPDYGSRMTSSIYVRGLGARIDQPVVGLTVDNIPYLNKDNYDFDITDIESIEVLRGAQSILNGRNTMGGQINIRTLSPMRAKGLRASAEYGTANTVKASASYYGKLSETLGMSLSGQYKHSDGYYRNAYNGSKTGRENSGSLRWKTAWQPLDRLSINNTAVVTTGRQHGYPYASAETGIISYADTCAYKRTSFADAVTVAWAGKRVVVTSISSVQYLDDCMDLDQDFLPDDYFTLQQARREWVVTEDLFTRGSRGDYSWLGGVYGFYKSTDMDAPVTFKDTGISQLIEKHRNEYNPDYPIRWDSRRFVLGSNFDMSSGGFALYHESTFRAGDWRIEAGLRLDIEKTSLKYHSFTNTGYTTMHILPDGGEEVYSHTPVDIDDHGDISHTYVELLPKFTISHSGDFEPYFTFSKGYKAGGYNTQMFSDVLQQRIMGLMGMSELYSFDKVVAYKPEKSFNYELGAHWRIPSARLKVDAALFLIDCRNQQLTVFPKGTTTGRMMTNAGRTRSMGVEISGTWQASDDVSARVSYGFTNATFRKYNDGRNDYRGKRVPYAPSNTLFAQLSWRATPLSFNGITPTATAAVRCAGNIYWNETNTVSQPFYCLPSLSLGLEAEHWSLRLNAENLSDTRYNTFYFVSIGNAFLQRGLPRILSASLRVKI